MVNATGAPSAYPFLSFFFLMAGGKKSRDGDAVGRRAERAGVRKLCGRIMSNKLAQQKSFHFLEKSSRKLYNKSTSAA
jgi:hypothetical protein